MSLRLFFSAFIFALIFVGCTGNNSDDVTGKPIVVVSILPQEWFVSRIAGDRVKTLVLAGHGQNPHNYEVSPRQIAELSSARVWVLSGAEFEISFVPKIRSMHQNLLIVDGTLGVNFRLLEDHDHDDFDDHDDHRENTGNIDRHTWLGLEPAKIMAAHIRNVLSEIDSENADFYQAQYLSLTEEISAEFDALRIELAPLRGRTVFVYHPSFGYFLDEFGIIQEAFETGGKEPGPQTLANLIEHAREENAAAIFVQAQFPVSAARTAAAAIGAKVIPLDPLSPDWLENIRIMGSALKNALILETLP